MHLFAQAAHRLPYSLEYPFLVSNQLSGSLGLPFPRPLASLVSPLQQSSLLFMT